MTLPYVMNLYDDGEAFELDEDRVEAERVLIERRWAKAHAIRAAVLAKLFEATDLNMGLMLQNIGRKAREELGSVLETEKRRQTHVDVLVRAVPLVLAQRLGVTNFSPEEQAILDSDPLDMGQRDAWRRNDADFRELVGGLIKNGNIGNLIQRAGGSNKAEEAAIESFPWSRRLDWDVYNGNIIALALDRAVPPNANHDDFCASAVRSTNRDEDVHGWSPALQARRDHRSSERGLDLALITAKRHVSEQMKAERKALEDEPDIAPF